jgi:hypothetical protein
LFIGTRFSNLLLVEVVSEVVYREAFAWAFVMFELGEVRDGQPQVLAVVEGPVLMHFHLIPK